MKLVLSYMKYLPLDNRILQVIHSPHNCCVWMLEPAITVVEKHI